MSSPITNPANTQNVLAGNLQQTERWKSTRHAVYNCAYHLIWCPKKRKKILIGNVETRLKEILYEQADKHGWIIEQMEIMPDHVHVFIKVGPTDSAVHVVSQLKGYSSFVLRKEFEWLKVRLKTLWTPSYYVETIGHISEDTIKRYIEEQKAK